MSHLSWSLLALFVLLLVAACGAPPLSIAPTPRPLVYVAIGASDAVGVGAAEPAREGWVPVLHGRLPEGARLVNLGISGSLLRDALVQQLPVALDAQPDLVTVWLAVNDFNARVPLEQYSADLDHLLARLHAETNARIVVANIPDLERVPVYQAIPRALLQAEIARWNATIGEVAARHGAVVVDLFPHGPELTGHPELVGLDGFHPSAAGYRRLAEVVWATLTTHQLVP